MITFDLNININVTLNAEICWSLALDRFPELANEMSKSYFQLNDYTSMKKYMLETHNELNSPQLFEASLTNTFAESFGIFEFDKFKEILQL